MLKTITHLKGFAIRATDGDLGTAEQLYFDDQSWTVRYLTVDTGGWLGGRRVLISPFSITGVNWQARRVDVSLTKQQVEDSPDINTHQPVSRQHETAYLGYFGYPNYWGGPFEWGPAVYPMGYALPVIDSAENIASRAGKESKDSHLRSTGGVSGYDIQAIDGEIGHVSGFVLDDETWSIRYLEVATRNWWPGKKILFSPAWIQRVSWMSSKVYVALSRAAIQTGPEYRDSIPIAREYENKLFLHYGRPPYWEKDAELAASLSLTTK
jgi:hypothetical protein